MNYCLLLLLVINGIELMMIRYNVLKAYIRYNNLLYSELI